MHGAHPQKPQSTSLTHSLIHFPQERRRGESFAAFSVSRETDRQAQGRARKLASPLGEMACDKQAGEGKRSFSRPQLKASQVVFHVKQTGKPTRQDGKTRLPLWGRWLAGNKPERAEILPHGIVQAICRKRQIFFRFPRAALPFRPALWYNVQRTQRARHSLCGRIASPGSERTGPRG